MRARMAENDTATDKVADIDGEIEWLFVEPEIKLIPEFETLTGDYAAVSKKAIEMNGLSKRIGGGVQAFVYYPSPIEELKTAA
jgi:hypothetical protein